MKGILKSFHFQNFSFRRKVICICLAVSMVPILLLGIFSYRRLYTQLVERENLALQETLRQETDSLNYKMDSYLNALDLIAWNEIVIQTLIETYSSNFDMYLAYRDTIDPLFLTVRSINTDISYICIYTEHNIYPHGNILRPLHEAEDFPWYEQACRSSVPVFKISEDQQVLYLACKIYDSRLRDINIVCLSIDMNTVLHSATTLFEENYGFLLIDSEGNPIYEYLSFADSEPLSAELLFANTSFPNYVVEKRPLIMQAGQAYYIVH